MTKDFLTTAEAARELGVTPARVRQLILAGRLPAEKHGRDWLIDPASLDQVGERRPGRPALEALDPGELARHGVDLVSTKLRLPLLRCQVCGETWAGRDWRCPNGCNTGAFGGAGEVEG